MIASHKFKDSILDIVGTSSHQIVVGMADGNIAMLSVSQPLLYSVNSKHLLSLISLALMMTLVPFTLALGLLRLW